MSKTNQSAQAGGTSALPSATAEQGSSGNTAPAASRGPRGLLAAVGRELEALGLEVGYFGSKSDPADIEVANPAYSQKGRISIGRDGYLIWERWGPAIGAPSAEAIVTIVAAVLANEAVPTQESVVH